MNENDELFKAPFRWSITTKIRGCEVHVETYSSTNSQLNLLCIHLRSSKVLPFLKLGTFILFPEILVCGFGTLG